jgi:hypothetical protein
VGHSTPSARHESEGCQVSSRPRPTRNLSAAAGPVLRKPVRRDGYAQKVTPGARREKSTGGFSQQGNITFIGCAVGKVYQEAPGHRTTDPVKHVKPLKVVRDNAAVREK